MPVIADAVAAVDRPSEQARSTVGKVFCAEICGQLVTAPVERMMKASLRLFPNATPIGQNGPLPFDIV